MFKIVGGSSSGSTAESSYGVVGKELEQHLSLNMRSLNMRSMSGITCSNRQMCWNCFLPGFLSTGACLVFFGDMQDDRRCGDASSRNGYQVLIGGSICVVAGTIYCLHSCSTLQH